MISQEKKPRGGKIALEKALKARLATLTASLATAEVGVKGIDLVKEIKELQSLLTAVDTEHNTKTSIKEEPRVVVVWGSTVNATPFNNVEQEETQKVQSLQKSQMSKEHFCAI